MPANSTMNDKVSVHIRWLIRRDMPEVMQIEQGCFAYPWDEEDFLRAMRRRNCVGMVAEAGEKVVGLMIYDLHTRHMSLLNFAVHPQWRRRGVGAQLVAKLCRKLSSHRRNRISLHVRETNLAAQLFFGKQAFKAVKVLRRYYQDNGEDAFLMEYCFGNAGTDYNNRIAQYYGTDEA